MDFIPTPRLKAIIRKFQDEMWNGRNPDALDEFCTDEFVMHDAMGDHDVVASKDLVQQVLEGTPDLEYEIVDLLAVGDKAIVRYAAEGTNEAPSYLADEPTGNHWKSTGISIYRFDGEKVAEQWDEYDYLGTMLQLGLISSESDVDPTGMAGAEA